ncbi:oxidoreductase [Devosia yakushimensis]|uniref:Oxidoreductase n=1 Tax=Devosia yakushimensis TaxID=470028 RepID=A0ABQ5UC60_9HYPH|nr:NAD(P)-binding domain-containing protein [Devosia yakushimensis]GLQ09690.1 oxidoreductase [Devosia yakushimensis]
MKIGVMGTGEVGSTVGGKLHALGHEVVFGSRSPGSDKARQLSAETGIPVASHQDAAAHGEWIVNALPGEQAIATLTGCALAGKILVDIGNYEAIVHGPIATPLGLALQAAFPTARLVKTLNSVSAHLMVDPASLGADHTVFVAGDDAGAKGEVEALLRSFGWRSILDLGDLTACRAMEDLVPMWMRLFGKFGDPNFNLLVARQS